MVHAVLTAVLRVSLHIGAILIMASISWFGWSGLRSVVARQVLLVFIVPVHDQVGGHASQQAIDQSSDLATGDHLRVDELTM